MNIDELELSVRPSNCLRAAGIETTDQLLSMSWHEIITMKNLGKQSAAEIVWACLAAHQRDSFEIEQNEIKARKYDQLISLLRN